MSETRAKGQRLTIEQRLEKLNESVWTAERRLTAATERRDGFIRALKARAEIAAWAVKAIERSRGAQSEGGKP